MTGHLAFLAIFCTISKGILKLVYIASLPVILKNSRFQIVKMSDNIKDYWYFQIVKMFENIRLLLLPNSEDVWQ